MSGECVPKEVHLLMALGNYVRGLWVSLGVHHSSSGKGEAKGSRESESRGAEWLAAGHRPDLTYRPKDAFSALPALQKVQPVGLCFE